MAAHADDPTSRYLTFASIGLDGYPANRLLVFRGFAAEGDDLLFATDTRSKKIDQLRSDVRTEACWYFPRTREQYRLRGDVCVIREACDAFASDRDMVWKSLSETVRKQFFWPKPGDAWSDLAPGSSRALNDSEHPPDAFAVLRMFVSGVDYLDLRTDPPTRWLHLQFREGEWNSRRVNP